MFSVKAQLQFVVQIILTTSSNTVGARRSLPTRIRGIHRYCLCFRASRKNSVKSSSMRRHWSTCFLTCDRCSGPIGRRENRLTFNVETFEFIAQRRYRLSPAEITQSSTFRSLSMENGGREHQPWLFTVFQKEKSGGVDMVIDVIMAGDSEIDVC